MTSVFNLGKRCAAIVLLDEADVAMTKRSSSKFERNAIVTGELYSVPTPSGCAVLCLTSEVWTKSG